MASSWNVVELILSFKRDVKSLVAEFLTPTIATRAKLMSFRIIKDTKKPDHDKKYSTKRAGIFSVINK